jgi:hypothetical protein
MIMRPNTHHVFAGPDTMVGDHDAGLEHSHDWAREFTGVRRHAPVVADASATRTPSSVMHDDAIYAAV